ncbi:MAG: UDP-2,3-diacylglucosamine diphosphatase [Gammaproteobacteria bacterium]|nr:UDP-2,3-diacylglucosamine diphosphatase [Gammaproteobacteria bacterium]MBV9621125.1 UDP-2,3-diacylglucosamine diphosphatase [Gammaproteobacteria bacterium]
MRRLLVSDVHLEAGAPAVTEQFLGFLTREASHAAALYVLGDLFETWVGDDAVDPDQARVCQALRSLGAQGVACFVLHGNRDFLLGEDFAARTGCRLLPDPVVALFDAEPVLLTHGDALCTDDHAYQELRSTVREALWQRRFLGLPRVRRGQLAAAARAGSRRHTRSSGAEIMDVNPGAVQRAFRVAQVRRMIHGHTHRPGIHAVDVDGTGAERIVLGAWHEAGSYLSVEQGQYRLHTLPRG